MTDSGQIDIFYDLIVNLYELHKIALFCYMYFLLSLYTLHASVRYTLPKHLLSLSHHTSGRISG